MFANIAIKKGFSRNKLLLAGNWKYNTNVDDSVAFVSNIINGLKFNHEKLGNSFLMLRYCYYSLECSDP